MKIQDLKIEMPVVVEDNKFVRVFREKMSSFDHYPDCYVITMYFNNGTEKRCSHTYLYRGNLPPLSKWYSISSLPALVRLVLYFKFHKDEVFTLSELLSIFKDVSIPSVKAILSIYLNYKIVLSTRKYFYGHEQALEKLERYLVKNKIPFRRIRNESKELVITIKRGSKERHFTYSY